MPFTITVEDARNDISLKQVSGVCSSSPQFLALMNELQPALAIRSNFLDKERRMKFCLSGCHIVWPHFVGTILATKFCGGLASIQNYWYSFVNNDMGQNWNYGYSGSYDGFYRSGGGSRCVVEDDGTRACYNEITGTTGKLIQYSIVKGTDLGKTITLFGRKYGAQPLQELSSGAWVMGTTLTAATPYVRSADLVTVIDSITRQETEGMAYLYEYDSSTNQLRDLAVFQPYETNPRYRCSRILNVPHGTKDSNGVCWTSVEALIRLKFIPLKHDRDFLMIDNMRAIKLAMQAIKLEQAGDDADAVVKWALAVKELQLEWDSNSPKRTVPIRMNIGRVINSPI